MSDWEGDCPAAEGSSKKRVLKYSPQHSTTSSGCLTFLPLESITESGSLDFARTPRLLKYFQKALGFFLHLNSIALGAPLLCVCVSHILLHHRTSSEFACSCLTWTNFSCRLTKNEKPF